MTADIERRALDALIRAKIQPHETPSAVLDAVGHLAPFDSMEDDEALELIRKLLPSMTSARRQNAETPGPSPHGRTQQGRHDGRSPGGGQAAVKSADVTSPFRFVALAQNVIDAGAELQPRQFDRSKPLAGGFSGRIAVEWAAETPLLIGQADGQAVVPMAFAPGDYIIPGATLKGMLRSTVEIVAKARLGDGNHHHRYGLRDFEHPLFNAADGDRHKRLSWEAIGAGIIRRATPRDPEKGPGDTDYVFVAHDKAMIRMEELLPAMIGAAVAQPGEAGFSAWARNYRDWLSKDLPGKYGRAGMWINGALDISRTRGFSVDTTDRFTTFARGGRQGFLVFAGRSYHKKPSGKKPEADLAAEFEGFLKKQLAKTSQNGVDETYRRQEYVFFLRGDAMPIRITEATWEQFRRLNSNPGNRTFKPAGSWKVLEATLKTAPIPVFHTGCPEDQSETAPNRFEIGLTRLFKIAHTQTVGDVVANNHPAHVRQRAGKGMRLDFAEALFGYVHEDNERAPGTSLAPADAARKGRVAFGFARLRKGQATRLSKPHTGVFAGPRASFAPFYMSAGHDGILDWSEPSAGLAGRKWYFPRFEGARAREAGAAIGEAIGKSEGNAGEDARSTLRFLESEGGRELVFSSEIRLHNVTAAEVGALLWALTYGGECRPGKPFRHMIGRARSFGAGQTRVRSIDLSRLAAHGSEGESRLVAPEGWERAGPGVEGWTPENGRSLGPFLRAFDAFMTKAAGEGWAATEDIQGLLGAASLSKGAGMAKQAGYPDLKTFAAIKSGVKLKAKHRRTGLAEGERLLGAPTQAATRPYRAPGA